MPGGTADAQEIAAHLKTLTRGLFQGDLRETYTAYRALYRAGEAAIPHIREAVVGSNWSRISRAGEVRYISGLISLLHDMSEDESRHLAVQIISSDCDIGIKKAVTSICRFTRSEYVTYEMRGVTVFEHKALADQAVRRALTRWLGSVPAADLVDLECLYVIPPDERESLGSYMPMLFNVTVVWHSSFSTRNPLSWLVRLKIRHTLYHEIGHHAHRHLWGQIPDQEEETNAYAVRRAWLSHPVVNTLAQGFTRCVRRIGLFWGRCFFDFLQSTVLCCVLSCLAVLDSMRRVSSTM